jgi:hypothetical protein
MVRIILVTPIFEEKIADLFASFGERTTSTVPVRRSAIRTFCYSIPGSGEEEFRQTKSFSWERVLGRGRQYI